MSSDGLAAGHGELVVGIALHSVQGKPVAGLSYTEVLDTIKTAGRPLRLSFIADDSGNSQDDDSDDEEEEARRRQTNERGMQRQQEEPRLSQDMKTNMIPR